MTIKHLEVRDILCEVPCGTRAPDAMEVAYNMAREWKTKVSFVFNGTSIEIDATKDWDMEE